VAGVASRGSTSPLNGGKAYNCQRRIRTGCLIKVAHPTHLSLRGGIRVSNQRAYP